MIPEHVLRKMRAALLVAGAAGCTRSGSAADAGVDGAATVDDASTTGDAALDVPDAATDDGGGFDVGDGGVDASVIACPFHPEGHAVLADGGVQQAKVESGLITISGVGRRDVCPGCGMGGPRPTTSDRILGDVQVGIIEGANDTQLNVLRRLMAGQRAGMRACYIKGLNADPSQEGTLLTTIAWSASGEVKTVTTNTSSSSLQASTTTCIAARLRHMITTPELAGATASVKLRFVVQK